MARKRKTGTVVHLASPTARVSVERMRRHEVYGKPYRVTTSFLVHVPSTTTVAVGDIVEIEETRPISKRKSWQVTKVTGHAGAVVLPEETTGEDVQ